MQTPLSIRERFPPPWHVKETAGGFAVETGTGILIASIYARDELAHQVTRRYLTTPEALAVAKAIAGLSEPAQRPT